MKPYMLYGLCLLLILAPVTILIYQYATDPYFFVYQLFAIAVFAAIELVFYNYDYESYLTCSSNWTYLLKDKYQHKNTDIRLVIINNKKFTLSYKSKYREYNIRVTRLNIRKYLKQFLNS